MEAIWNTVYSCIGIFLYLFSWALFLALGAKFIFGAEPQCAVSCLFIGIGINVAILVFGGFRLHPMTILYIDKEWESHWVTSGLILTPVIISAFGGLYLAFRRLVLADTDHTGCHPSQPSARL